MMWYRRIQQRRCRHAWQSMPVGVPLNGGPVEVRSFVCGHCCKSEFRLVDTRGHA